ncbi:MAG: hypothetical protein WBP81_18360 [Solirubrobacteraceae bacterium]
MEKFDKTEGTNVYAEPVIEDFGTLQELTASGGASFTDVPSGTPVNGNVGNVAGSTP